MGRNSDVSLTSEEHVEDDCDNGRLFQVDRSKGRCFLEIAQQEVGVFNPLDQMIVEEHHGEALAARNDTPAGASRPHPQCQLSFRQ